MVSLVVAVGGRGRRIVDLFNVGFRLFSNEQGGPLPSQGFPRPSPFGERPSDTDPEQGKPRVTGQYAKYGFPLLTGKFSGFVETPGKTSLDAHLFCFGRSWGPSPRQPSICAPRV